LSPPVTETEQPDLSVPVDESAHVMEVKVSPASEELNVTVPVGLDFVPVLTSVTVTLTELAGPPSGTVDGVSVTAVVVARRLTWCGSAADVEPLNLVSPR
jgi:hypothetical protein